MRLGSYPEIGWCVRCELELREGKEVVDREMHALEAEYALFRIAARVAGERLKVAAEELGNVGLVAGPSAAASHSTVTDSIILSNELTQIGSARNTLADTPENARSTSNRPPSRPCPSGRMARRGGGHNTTSRVSGNLPTTNTHRSMLTPSTAGRGRGGSSLTIRPPRVEKSGQSESRGHSLSGSLLTIKGL
jgi:hypothetical protein